MSASATSSQTVGPFFVIGCAWQNRDKIAGAGVSGERVTIEGCVLDGDGKPVPDALIEIWQANSQGKYAHPDDTQSKPTDAGFQGFGRIPTDDDGKFRFTTIKPGPTPGPDGKSQAPHLAISVFARGLLKRLVTRIYFPDESGNGADYVLNLVDPARRGTLIAKKTAAPGTLEWNVILQGAGETVFFDV
ncbi:MAG: protocatechuate 3,4-dioxygenase subunit alpha [Candidatus Acidiferrales bacterium]